jgi:hypothetical protein
MSSGIDFSSGDVCQIVANEFTLNRTKKAMNRCLVMLDHIEIRSGYHHDHYEVLWSVKEYPKFLIDQRVLVKIVGLSKPV